MPAKPSDPARDLRILRAARDGLSPGELAQRFNLSPGAVRDALRRAREAAAAGRAGATSDREARV